MSGYAAIVQEQVRLGTAGEIRFFQNRRKQHREALHVVKTEQAANSAVNCIQFSPYDYDGESTINCGQGDATAIVCAGTHVQFYSREDEWQMSAEITDFRDVVHCCRVREDGQLFITADATGQVKIIKAHKRVSLRRYRTHRGIARSAVFLKSKSEAVSVGDDHQMFLYDISAEEPVQKLKNIHTDQVRVCEASPQDEKLVLTGSLDGLLKVWDIRLPSKKSNAITFKDKRPIQTAAFLHTQPVIAANSDSVVKLWDMRQATGTVEDCLQKRSHHLGAISDLKVATDDSHILTASSDKTLKLVSLEMEGDGSQFQVKRSIQLNDRPSSCAISRDSRHFAAGFETGEVIIYETVANKKRASESHLVPGSTNLFRRAKEPKKQVEVKELDGAIRTHFPTAMANALKSHQYQKCMKNTIEQGSPELLFVLVRELASQGSLATAMRGYTEEEVKQFLDYLRSTILTLSHEELYKAHAVALQKFMDMNDSWLETRNDESLWEGLCSLREVLQKETIQAGQLIEIGQMAGDLLGMECD
eukprot:Protomagalhaensia_sp_Gyna_25__1425@NODE_171_length_4657_cov_23_754439_g133_i0_p1_GENE_NODE_171_length_4657_cov_23_754439_g133_i0NODE_171_length_4657_cov_23_754439_g133_i0_p1_ORF_typecomplete_len532_score101_96ANAPC4_WD40/PF12894_7/3_1e02ANAPC4_WD40/PF12894_7/6_8e05ANAPC4_WD40/PF12894_7/0_001ANAPC4_WD40/PF12894_7/79ANAPC4_WD40/PF12894_7/0_0081ANAPC4_WD40/PF12894_7/1_2WD40/PF00400_32/48WD40/PF00400_32/47WD40/PF00400_32/0_0016WD40/PF00400_32/58WD40/PF00400_32/0_056WD40/PF00400_32/33WD40_like/PF1700